VQNPIRIGGGYPPIILRDEAGTSGGKLQAQKFTGGSNSLLVLSNNVRVTLAGGLILAGTGDETDHINGVYVDDGAAFTMDGGEISGHSSGLSPNGGVFVANSGTFTMNDGKISGNSSGGVFVEVGTFTMNGGLICNNTAESSYYYSGGGVLVGGSGTFIMNDGEISGNSAASYGGGVCVADNGTFIMKGGEIAGNKAATGGGGVYVFDTSSEYYGKFEKTGGIIYGVDEYDAKDPASKGNIIIDVSGGKYAVKGNAASVGNGGGLSSPVIRHKEATIGPKDILRYKYLTGEDIFGWD
jgi:hypothetical protein